MRLVSLEVRNFKKLGRKGLVKINFPEEGVIAVVGENEAGKSTLADAIFYALTGKTGAMVGGAGRKEKERAEEVISWGAREMEMRLRFKIGESEYEVYRRRGKSSPYARLTGKRNVEGWEAVNNAISELMSGMDDLSLITTIFSAQKDTDRPVIMKEDDRRRVITGMLGMDPWEGAKKKLDDVERDKKKKRDELENNINGKKSRIEEIENAIRNLGKKKDELENTKKELENLSKDIEKAKEEVKLLDDVRKRYDEIKNKLSDKIKELAVKKTEIKRIIMEKEGLESDISRLKEDLKNKDELKRSKEERIRELTSMATKLSGRYPMLGIVSGISILVLGLLLTVIPLAVLGILIAIASYPVMRAASSWLIREAGNLRKELGTIVPEDDQLREKEGKLRERENEIESLKEEIRKLEEEKEKAEAELKRYEEDVGGNPADLFSKAEKKLVGLEEKEKSLKDRKRELEEDIKEIEKDRERLDDLKKQLNELKEEKEKLERDIEVIKLAVELVDAVITRIWGSVAPSVGNNIGKFLHKITLGRYYRARVGEEDWSVSVYVPERAAVGQDPYVSVFRMSGGTQDQVILALRLAVITSLVGKGENWPEFLILDEVLGATDDRRREGEMELLKSLRQQFPQIILITHQEDVAEMADMVLRVEDGMVHEISARIEESEHER